MVWIGFVFFTLAILSVVPVEEWEDFFRGVRFVVFMLLFLLLVYYANNKEFFHQVFDLYRETCK